MFMRCSGKLVSIFDDKNQNIAIFCYFIDAQKSVIKKYKNEQRPSFGELTIKRKPRTKEQANQ